MGKGLINLATIGFSLVCQGNPANHLFAVPNEVKKNSIESMLRRM